MPDSSTYRIVITNPCDEKWENMQPDELGRHCAFCNKTVVDFTLLDDEAVKKYFLQYKNIPTCGRFFKKQVDTIRIEIHEQVLYANITFWKKFLVVFMLCFSTQLFAVEFVLTDSLPTDSTGVFMSDSSQFNPSDTELNTDTTPRLHIDTTMIPPEIKFDNFPVDYILSGFCTIISGGVSIEIETTKVGPLKEDTIETKSSSSTTIRKSANKNNREGKPIELPHQDGMLPETAMYLPNRKRVT